MSHHWNGSACRECEADASWCDDPPAKPASAEVLEQANKIIHGDRAESYGSAEESFSRIAALWTAYLDRPISAHDVAICMVLLKVSRAKSDHKMDTTVDMAGYAALAQRMVGLLPAQG